MDNSTEIKNIIHKAIELARRYKELTGKPLGITGEVAEVLVSDLLNLQLCLARQSGYDSTDSEGVKYQIKGRVVKSSKSLSGRTGKINIEKEWDFLLLALLNDNFEIRQIIKAPRDIVIASIIKPGSKSRNERWSLSCSKVKEIGNVVFP